MNHALALVQFAFLPWDILRDIDNASIPPGGGLDAYGCHNNRKAGGYHCHRGAIAGEAFSSKAEMLDRLKATNGGKRDTQTKSPKK